MSAGLVQMHRMTLKAYIDKARENSRKTFERESGNIKRRAAEHAAKSWLARWWSAPEPTEAWSVEVALDMREKRLDVLEAGLVDNAMVFLTLEELRWLKSWAT